MIYIMNEKESRRFTTDRLEVKAILKVVLRHYLLPMILLLIGMVLLVYSGVAMYSSWSFVRNAESTYGNVVSERWVYGWPEILADEGETRMVTVEFRTADSGRVIRFEVGDSKLRLGEQVEVIYNPARPSQAEINEGWLDLFQIIGLGFGITFGIWGLLSFRHRAEWFAIEERINGWPAWQLVTGQEHTEIWDKFKQQFEFHDVVPKNWPPKEGDWQKIKEPVPSITYRVEDMDYEREERPDHLDYLNQESQEVFLQHFQNITPEGDWIYALHIDESPSINLNIYKFYPHTSFQLDESNEWPVPMLPDGFYYAFLEKHLNFGVFGHPWEQTICVFGEKLLSQVDKQEPMLFNTILRTNGIKG